MASNIGPVEIIPENNDCSYAYLTGAATYVLVEGACVLDCVQTGVAGGAGANATVHDARTGDALSGTNKVAVIALTGATSIRFHASGGLALGRGLTIILTGATVEATVSFQSPRTTNPRQFGVA